VNIVVIGLNHTTAPVEIREKLAFSEDRIQHALATLMKHDGICESFILSTCNRVEIYACVQDCECGVDHIKKFLARYHTVPSSILEESLYVHTGEQGIKHLFRVASSLDSLVVGEPQILGQLKDAFDSALDVKATGLILNKLIKKAISVAKRVRTETRISESGVSIGFAAVELAKKIFGNLEGKTAMLLGAGDMAERAARHLQDNGIRSVLVVNRTFDRAVELAREFHGSAVPFEQFSSELMMADIVICSTGARGFLVFPEMVSTAIKERRSKPMFFIDISVPRNIDPRVNDLDNAFLYTIDDLEGIVSLNKEGRAREAKKAEKIVQQEIKTYLQWEQSLDAVPVIVDLREHMEEIRKRELRKALAQLKGITDKQRNVIESMSAAIVNKIAHTPAVVLKKTAAHEDGTEWLSFARTLFNLDGQKRILKKIKKNSESKRSD